MDVPQTRVMFFSVRLKYNLGWSCRMMLESWKARSLPWWSALCAALYHQQLSQDNVVYMLNKPTWSSYLRGSRWEPLRFCWAPCWTGRPSEGLPKLSGRNSVIKTGVGREVDLNASKLNFKLTHRSYNLLTAGLESTLLVAGEDPLLSGQTSPWFQLSTHKVYSATLFTLTRDLQQFTHWFVPQMRPNMRREGRAAAACCRFSVQTWQRHRD